MAKDSGILNYVLIGGAAYLAWQWFQSSGASTPGTTTGQPTGTATPPLQQTPTQTTQSNINPGAQACSQVAMAPPWQHVNDGSPCGKWVNPTQGTGNGNPITIAGGTVNGVPYSGTKSSYTAAVLKALGAVANNSQSQTIDEWNWFMDHIGFNGFSTGGGDPDQIMTITGTGAGDAISPATYVDAIQKLGLLPYPSGLTGLAALAAGINRINRHPLAQGAPGNPYYPKPRKVVI